MDRLEYFLRSRGSKVVVLALVANTMVAQLLYNSAGQLCSAIRCCWATCSSRRSARTVAFALFEVCTIFQLHDLMALDASHQGGDRRGEADQAGLLRPGRLLADQLPLGALLPGPGLAHRLGRRRRSSRSTICRSPGTGSTTASMPLPTRRCCSWRASSASGPRAAKRSSSPPSARWSSKPWSAGGCRRKRRSSR